MINSKFILLLLLAAAFPIIGQSKSGYEQLETFKKYYAASKDDSNSKWDFTTDPVKLWFDDKTSKPILQSKESSTKSKWQEWDEEMHSTGYYDSLWYDADEHAVKGYFYENNDFYKLIGKSPTKTLRTYWFNQDDKIKEILIYWIPEENTTTSEHLNPVVEWAMQYDSTEIKQLYPEGRIVPSRENAKRWKELLTEYNNSKMKN